MKKIFTLLFGLTFSMLTAQCPDLKITHAIVLERNANNLRYALNISNIGDQETRLDGITSSLSDNVVIASYLSQDTKLDLSDLRVQDVILGIAPLTSIKSNEVYSVINRDSIASSGYRYLIIHIDATNQINECAELNNVFILELKSNTLTLEVPILEGFKGQQIEIPVYASDFNSILGFQFSVSFSNPTVFKIDSIGNLGLAELIKNDIRVKSNNSLGVVWLSSDSGGLTFNGKRRLFSIYVTLIGDPGTCTDIHFDHSFLPIEFISSFPLTEPIKVETISGQLCIQNLIECSGKVTFSNFNPINNVIVKANHHVTTTNISGRYSFKGLEPGLKYTVSADKVDFYSNGLSVMDILMIKKHLLQIQLLPSPYEIIAADVNGDLIISVQDIVLIRSIILGLIPDFGKTPVWQFIPKDYKFLNPLNPLAENYPISFTLNPLNANKINVDFIGIKTGDVNLDWFERNAQVLESRLASDYFKLKIPEQKLKANADYIIPIRADKISMIAGLQLALKMDSSFSISKITTPSLNGFNIQNYALADHTIKILWHESLASSVPEKQKNDTLFLFYIHTNKAMNSKDLFTLKNQIIEPLVVNQQEKQYGIKIESLPIPELSRSNLHLLALQAYPNPVTDVLQIRFENPVSGLVGLRIMDPLGRAIYHQDMDLTKGPQEFKLHVQDWLAGAYHVCILSGLYQESKTILCIH